MAEFSGYGGYDYAPAEYDYSSWYQPTDEQMAGNWGFGGFGEALSNVPWTPEQSTNSLISEPEGPSGFNPTLASEPPPAIGQGGPGPKEEEDIWSQLKKAGGGMGVGLAGQVASKGLQALMTPSPKQQRSPLPMAPGGQQYTPEPLEALPGTKASPLISGRPAQVKGSQGLRERRPSYGGFSMY